MARPCLDCGTLSSGTRCPTHTTIVNTRRTQAKRTRRPRATTAETQRRADTITAWVTTYGWVCPGWQRPPHASTDLTADHITSYATTRSEATALTVLCRRCNSRKGSQPNRT